MENIEFIKLLAITGLTLISISAIGVFYFGMNRILSAAKSPRSLKDALALLCLISFWLGFVLAIEVAIKVALNLSVILIVLFIIFLILFLLKDTDGDDNEDVNINKIPFIFKGIVKYLLKLDSQIPENLKCKWGINSIILTIILLILSLILIIINFSSLGYLCSLVKIWPNLPFTYFLCFCGIMITAGYYFYLLYGISLIIMGLILKKEKNN